MAEKLSQADWEHFQSELLKTVEENRQLWELSLLLKELGVSNDIINQKISQAASFQYVIEMIKPMGKQNDEKIEAKNV